MSRRYYDLIASLPALPSRFDVDRCPISWPRLEERLRVLAEHDAAVLGQLVDFLAWDRQPLERMDQEVVERYDQLTETVKSPLVRDLVDDRMDVRTIVCAVRRRRRGEGPPVGVGRLVPTIRLRWNEPTFGLGTRFPWIEEFSRAYAKGDAVDAERTLLAAIWKVWNRRADDCTFSFDAVLLYVARWSVVNRWTSRSATVGRERFEGYLERALKGHVASTL